MLRPFFLVCCLFLAATVYTQKPTIDLQSVSLTVPSETSEKFLAYKLYKMDYERLYELWQSPEELIEFELQSDQELLDFELNRYDLRAPNYTLISGSRLSQDATIHPRRPSAQFKGLLTSDLSSTAIFTIDEDYVMGYWGHQNGDEYFLEPLWRFWPAAPKDVYVYYRADQVAPINGVCGTDQELHTNDLPVSTARSAMGECLEVELSLASDFELYNDFGSVTATENFMLNTLALVQTNYDSQNGDQEFDDELRFYVVNTYIANSNSSDPWTNSTDAETLLESFRDWGNAGNFDNPYDVAALWTGRNMDGTTIGIAWLSAVCTSVRYNVNENFSTNNSSLRVLWAHELGHNFGSNHDSSTGFIMSPSVNNTTTWSTQSRNAINNYYQGVSCLDICPNVAPSAGFTINNNQICPGNSVTFNSTSTGNISSYSWSFPGGTPSSSTEENPTVTYNNAGNFTATLTVSNAAGSDDSQQNITVSEGLTDIRISENFEDGAFGDISIDNPDGGTTWQLANVSGNGGSVAAYINNYNYNAPGQIDRLVLPIQDFSNASSMRLEFEYAYARYNNNLNDQLQVTVKVGPTGTPNVLFVGTENGGGNFATAPDQTSIFTANDPNDWCFNGPQCIDLDLSAYDGLSGVEISIENINGYGNSMFIDNILLSGICSAPSLPVEWLSFEAKADKDRSVLNWQVNQDELHAGFVIERANSQFPEDWKTMGYLARKGAAGNNVAYDFYDYEVAMNQTYLYRLKQQDIDGKESFSPIRSVWFGKFDRVSSLFPNPSEGQVTLLTDGQDGTYLLQDAQGRKIEQGTLTGVQTHIDLTGLRPGLYFIRLLTKEGKDEPLRIIRQ